MKLNKLIYLCGAFAATVSLVSCEDFLDREPISDVTPEEYYQTEEQIQAAVNKLYEILPGHSGSYGVFGQDVDTDNQTYTIPGTRFSRDLWKVSMTGGSWAWEDIRNINYTLSTVLENQEKGLVKGNETKIKHYIGELHFLRAFSYFKMLRAFGDLPIIKEPLPVDEGILIDANKRSPRNEVARFILNDLDKALENMTDGLFAYRNRLSLDAVTLFKSRVALFEASWLKNFKGTAFVPNGEGWPGKQKEYNTDYEYPLGSIDDEIMYFYDIAAKCSEEVAEKYKDKLTVNTGVVPQSESDVNPYFYMFGAVDMSSYPDILLWRQYGLDLKLTHYVEVSIQQSNGDIGLTRNFVESFIMADGKPIYASHDGFKYDDTTIGNVRTNTDPRLHIFLKEPNQKNAFKNMDGSETHMVEIEPYPNILTSSKTYPTGYALRKGGTFDRKLCENGLSYNGCIVFRATEALLNYMEAQYELTGNLYSGHILEYLKAVRKAAGFHGNAINPEVTINATVMTNEKGDWGSYTAGAQLTDPILYNIRRERRCEFIGEDMRHMDLARWRSYDQLISEPVHIEGIHFWGTPMQEWYEADDLKYDGTADATISSPERSEYIRPHEKNLTSGNPYKDGLTWRMGHYLEPLPIRQFLLTADDHATIKLSPLYQNPYWPMQADMPAEK